MLAVGHENPDADTLGATLGVVRLVEANGAVADPVCTDPIPPLYDFLDGVERFRTDPDPTAPYDLVVISDCGSLERIGDVVDRHAELFARLPRVIIDHHASNDADGEADWIDPHAAATCDLIVVNSEYTANDVAERLGFTRERIVVAHPGVDERFTPSNSLLPGDEGYVLMLSPGDPRKNHANLAAAMRLLPDMRLVAPNHVSDEELPALYRGAAVFAYPSFFEGFGIPVLEAMASGTPVVVSSHPSLDEASGQAAVRVDPDSPEAIADGIRTALAERESLVAKGLEHAKRFTWRACGEAHLHGFLTAT